MCGVVMGVRNCMYGMVMDVRSGDGCMEWW